MRWVARALVGTSSIRGCGGASGGFPRGWGGLVPVDVAADGGAWLLIVALVGAALGSCALRLLACCVARLLRARRERRIVRAWSGPSPAIRRGGTSPPAVNARLFDPLSARLRAGLRVLRRAHTAHHRGRAQGTPSPREIALLVAEVATRLRAGAPVSSAWTHALARIGVGSTGRIDDVYPPVLDQWAREPSRWRALLTGGHPPEAAAARFSAASVIVACRFSHGLGAPLADVLDAIGDAIDDAQAVEEARRVASAGPLMSARVLAALPLVGIVASLALGASPWSFYTGGGPGSACAVSGLAAWGAGIASCRRIVARCRSADAGVGRAGVGRAGPPIRADSLGSDAALACDLVASALACGASIPRSLDALAHACAHEALSWTAAALRLGATWDEAWEDTPTWAAPLRDALEASWTAGTAPDGMLARCATWERRTRLVDARTKAEELSVRLVGPLGAFFLPAFLLLGIAPLLAHLMTGIGG
nr:type II secretion system F family protein [uncultured Actinomyces sp.]